MPAGYPTYPGPREAEEGKSYTYENSDGESVVATVSQKVVQDDGGLSISLNYEGGN